MSIRRVAQRCSTQRLHSAFGRLSSRCFHGCARAPSGLKYVCITSPSGSNETNTRGIHTSRHQLYPRIRPTPRSPTPIQRPETQAQPEPQLIPPGSQTLKETPEETLKGTLQEVSEATPEKLPPLSTSNAIRLTETTTQPQFSTKADHQTHRLAQRFFSQAYSFLYSAETVKNHPVSLYIPEIIVLGASNVGKSSFLNALVGRTKAARVSQRPGHTITMNAYGVGSPEMLVQSGMVPKGVKWPDHGLRIMDTPGYGYKSRRGWGTTIVKYLELRKSLKGAVVLLSAEKKLYPDDKWLLRTLAETDTKTMIVLTKADKLGSKWPAKCAVLAEDLRQEMRGLVRSGWREGSGWNPDIYVTAAGMNVKGGLGNGGGMGGARTAIIDMAGYQLSDKVETKPEDVSYEGDIVGFDDIQWKA